MKARSLPVYGGRWHASYCYFVLEALLVALLIGSAVGKSVEFSEPLDYVLHYTNWSWTFQIVFYATLLISFAPQCVPCAGYVVAFTFFPLLATVSAVAVLVWIMLGTDDAGFLEMIFENIHPGYVMIGNDWVHVWPIIFLLIWALARYPLVYYGLNWLFTHETVRSNDRCLVAVLVWQIFAFLLPVGVYFVVLYALGTNPNEVYGTELNVGGGLVIASFVSLVVVGSLLFLCGRSYGMCRRRSPGDAALMRRRVTTTEFEDELLLAE